MPFTPTIEKDADLTKVRGHLSDAAKYALELRSLPADKRGKDFTEDIRSAVDFIHEFDAIEKAMQASQREAIDQAIRDAEAAKKKNEGKGGRSLGANDDEREYRSLGRQVIEAEGFEEWQTGRRDRPFVTEVRNLIGEYPSGQFDTGANHWLPINTPALYTPALQRRRAFLRDLIGVQPTGLASFAYLRETTPVSYETGAGMTSEGSAKQEVTMLWEPADAPARKITAWIPVTDEMLADAPTLRGYIDARMEYMVMIREEAQVYNGDGNAPNLQGLKGVTGVQTESAVSGDFPATIANAIAKVENVDGEADGVACNPINFWTAVGKRHADQFDNAGNGNAPALLANITWGLPCVRTRALASGSAMVAAWRLGATIFQRQGVEIKVADQHSDNFIKNIAVIRAEERIALPIWRPNLFVDVTVPTS